MILGDGAGTALALAPETGEIIWSVVMPEEVTGSPAVVGELVFLGSADGSLRALDVETGEERWKEQTAYGVYSSPAIAGDMIVIGMGYYDLWAFAHDADSVAPGEDVER